MFDMRFLYYLSVFGNVNGKAFSIDIFFAFQLYCNMDGLSETLRTTAANNDENKAK